MSSTTRLIEVSFPEAEFLAHLYGIAFDLETAASLCDKAVELGRPRPNDFPVIEGLVAAAVVRYGRCFASGVRRRLKREDLAKLDASDLAAHDYFKALRDKFVAHSVNPFEDTYVTAAATERDGIKLPITSVNAGQHRLALSPETAKALADLVAKVDLIVRGKVASEERRLLAVIQALPIETIHNGDLHTPHRFHAGDVHKPRKSSSPSNKRSSGATLGPKE